MAGAPVRYPSGVTNEDVRHTLGNFTQPNPNRSVIYSNDFFTYLASDWTVVAGGAGSSVAIQAGKGGLIRNTCATSGSECLSGNAAFNFQPATSVLAGSQTWFTTSVVLDATVANPDYAIGLMKGTLSTVNSATDGVYFTKATGATVWSLVIKATAGSTTTIALPASTVPTASQVVNLGFYFNGKDTLYVYFNDVMIGSVGPTGTLGTSLANLPGPTIFLAPAYINAFHTATSTLDIDYVLAATDRTN